MEAGQEILQLVDLHQLTATVRIRQEDTNLVKIRQPVTFKSRDPLSPDYQATVQDILPIIGAEQPGTNPMATLQILINNENNGLLPGGEGYAHIKTGEMRVYHKVQHELSKLFQVGKYFPWLSSDR